MKQICVLIFFSFIFKISFAQEFLINNGNPVLQTYSKKYVQKNSKNFIDTLELPFVDDFSNSYIYPDETKWIDNHVFINNDYCKNNISYNVATFDAIDSKGNIYNDLSSSSAKKADYLTSLPINLDYLQKDSIYLSFFYQCGGKGEKPDERDCLVLEFYSSENQWIKIWEKAGKKAGEIADSTFTMVLLPIKDKNFLYKGFKFRFLNYVTIGSNIEPSWRSNCDVWNIDYVKLDKNRNINDTILNDIAFVQNFTSFLKGYESVPCKHYAAISNKAEIMNNSVLFAVNSYCLDPQNEGIGISRDFYLYNSYSLDLLKSYLNDKENIYSFYNDSVLRYNKNIEIEFPITEDMDSAKFTLLGSMTARNIADPLYTRWNDTIRYYQYFENYYAYDDGTAEAGYGIKGVGAKVAYKFDILVGDTLKGVYMYFNKTLNEANIIYFYLSVWKNNNGYPGDLYYEMEGIKPQYSQLNEYVYYKLEKPIYIDSTFYIGWRKTTNDDINLGVDFSRDASDKLYYTYNGQWTKSQFNCALMLRPVFGKEPKTMSINNYEKNISNFNIYPNPTNESFNIDIDANNQLNIEIYDISGKLLLSSKTTKNINISSLNSGIYFVKINSDNEIYNIKKLIIQK